MAIELALPRIYDAAIEPAAWEGALDEVATHVGSRGASLHLSDHLDPVLYELTYVSKWWRELPAERVSEYMTKFSAAEKPIWDLAARIAPQILATDEQAFGNMEQVRLRPDYQFLQAELGVYRRMGTRLNSNASWLDVVAFQFGTDTEQILASHIASATQLLPHIAKSFELGQLYRRLNEMYGAVLSTLDKVQVGLCIVRPDRRVVVSNSAAQECFENADGLILNAETRLVCADPRIQTDLEKALHTTMLMPDGRSETHHQAIFIARRSGKPPYFIEVSPLSDAKKEIAPRFSGAIVTIIDPSRKLAANLERLSLAYGLTAAETAITELLIQGLSNADIADSRSVRVDTVKHQIKGIMFKTGTTSRTNLLRLAVQTSPPII